jgi:glycosyltransferase involved in cell wall biosynthesis
MKKFSVAVLLSGGAQFSPYYGGALARWTYEVYSRLQGQIDTTVFGVPTRPQDLYPLAHESTAWSRACSMMARVPLLRRYEDFVWLRSLMPRLTTFDVVHVHNRPQWAHLLRQLGYRGCVVIHIQNDHLGHWTKPMLDSLAPALDSLVVCSTYLHNQFVGNSAALDAKTRVVFNGVNRELFHPHEEVREPKTIFFVGSLIPAKGPLHLVRAYSRVLEDQRDAKLIIGGSFTFGVDKETPYIREIRREAESIRQKHGVEIQFPGYIHHDRDLPSFFQKAALFSSPSIFQEPFGLVNCEAMACATPVVGSNRGGIPEVLADTGQLIDPENEAQYASTLSALLSDAGERARLGRATYERCRRMFDWSVIADSFMPLLDDLIGATTLGSERSKNRVHRVGAG